MTRSAMTQSPATFPECEGGILVRPGGRTGRYAGKRALGSSPALNQGQAGAVGLAL